MKTNHINGTAYETPKTNVVTLGATRTFLEVSAASLIIESETFTDEEEL